MQEKRKSGPRAKPTGTVTVRLIVEDRDRLLMFCRNYGEPEIAAILEAVPEDVE